MYLSLCKKLLSTASEAIPQFHRTSKVVLPLKKCFESLFSYNGLGRVVIASEVCELQILFKCYFFFLDLSTALLSNLLFFVSFSVLHSQTLFEIWNVVFRINAVKVVKNLLLIYAMGKNCQVLQSDKWDWDQLCSLKWWNLLRRLQFPV